MGLFGKKREHGQEPPPRAGTSPFAADPHAELRELFYGDQPLRQWVAVDADLRRAADLIDAGAAAGAVALLQPIAGDSTRESRVRLVAWNALRALGVTPRPDDVATVLGVVLEVPMHGGRDTLAAYADGRARYVNYSGAVTVFEPATGAAERIVAELVTRAQVVANVIGPWEGPRPPLPPDSCRVGMLCPGGFYFGQGNVKVLTADPLAGPVLATGARLIGSMLLLKGSS